MRYCLAALAGAITLGLPSVAQDLPDAEELYLDLLWCGEEAVIQRRVFADIKASLDELGEADRVLAEAIRKPAIKPVDLMLDRQRLAYFHGVPDEAKRKASKQAAGRHWYGVPVDAGPRLSFYVEKSDQYGEAERPNCYMVWTQALATIDQAKAERLDGKVALTEAALDAINEDTYLLGFEGAAALPERAPSTIARTLLEGGLTPEETHLLAELAFGRTEISDGERAFTVNLEYYADFAVLPLLIASLDMTDLWQKDAGLAGALVLLADVSPRTHELVQNFAARQMLARWQESSITNQYAPFRNEVSLVQAITADLPEVVASSYFSLAYEAARMVDDRAGDTIPDMLYNGLRPAAE